MQHRQKAANSALAYIREQIFLLSWPIQQFLFLWYVHMMNNFSGLILAMFCLTCLSATVQANEGKQGKENPKSGSVKAPKVGKMFRECRDCPQMIAIPAGSFDMGSPESEVGRGDDENPVHQVKVSAFALGIKEVTRGQFAAFVKKTHYKTGEKCWKFENGKFEERAASWQETGYLQDDKHPVACISWNDARAYAKWISTKTGKKYRLPTEAEWEYAARASSLRAYYWEGSADDACEYGNGADKTAVEAIKGATSWNAHQCTDNFAYTSPVGTFKPNALGLYDMLGNLWEWTQDNYHENYENAPADGSRWEGDDGKRVLRGGSWNNGPRSMRAAVRTRNKPELRFSTFGFRLVRELP